MSKLVYDNQLITSDLVKCTEEKTTNQTEKFDKQRTIVFKTLIDPAVARIAAEKNKHKIFNNTYLSRNSQQHIDFVATEKFYEPYIVASGSYFIDYYRKSAYALKVDREAKEVVVLNHTFKLEADRVSRPQAVVIEGEERLIKRKSAFLILNRYGEDGNSSELPTGPCEENPEDMVMSLKMQEIPANLDVDVIRNRIAERPNDINRLVSESLEVKERSIIYTPRFRFTYKCLTTGKQASIEFDAVTNRQITHIENTAIATIEGIVQAPIPKIKKALSWLGTKFANLNGRLNQFLEKPLLP